MVKRIIVSMFLLGLIAILGIKFGKKQLDYRYAFSVPQISEEKRDRDFMERVSYNLKRIKGNPSDHQSMARLARLYSERAKELDSTEYYLLAARYAYKSISYTPKYNPSAYYVLADIAQSEHDYQVAIRYAQTIFKQKNSLSPEVCLILANSHLALGNLEQAMKFADEFLLIFPSEKAYTLRGTILADQGRDQEAINDFEEGIKLLEDNPLQASYTRAMYAQFLISRSTEKGNLENAKTLLREALRITPDSALALGLMGSLYEKEKKFPEAIKYFQAAFKQSKMLSYLLMEARGHKLSGEIELANTLFAQAESLLRMDLMKNKRASSNNLIRMLLERGNIKDFSELLNMANREKSLRPSSEAFLLYSWALEMNGQLLDARKVIRGMLARSIHSEEVLIRAASIEEKLKNKKLANIYKNQGLVSRTL